MLHNIVVSTWRTLAPYVVGFLVVQAARLGIDLDETSVMSALTIAVGTVYHAVVRLLEEHLSPRWGWLIGFAAKPDYQAVRGDDSKED